MIRSLSWGTIHHLPKPILHRAFVGLRYHVSRPNCYSLLDKLNLKAISEHDKLKKFAEVELAKTLKENGHTREVIESCKKIYEDIQSFPQMFSLKNTGPCCTATILEHDNEYRIYIAFNYDKVINEQVLNKIRRDFVDVVQEKLKIEDFVSYHFKESKFLAREQRKFERKVAGKPWRQFYDGKLREDYSKLITDLQAVAKNYKLTTEE
ncbi:hypothetical protein [Candidatus Sneabacter namystus]|uniref:Uncharacterized protein n=1 Tax=Candidatus Sneabacter namystus TaxID=2601646 RepID=A0A5C0UHY8_9RICK|nr:hypothetical protein [Candidatus Sneabacter namystus]QEK39359.1 hypothetical protein FZC37_00140 [Candidatus Sneabacter namystus]